MVVTGGRIDSRYESLISLHQCVAAELGNVLVAQAGVGERWNERQTTRNLEPPLLREPGRATARSHGMDKRRVVCGSMGDVLADEKAQLRDSGCIKNVSIDTE